MDPYLFFVKLLSGLFAGALTGLSGLGSAIFVFPALVLLLNYNPYLAIGVSMITDTLMASFASYGHWKKKNINVKKSLFFSVFLILGGIIGSVTGAFTPYNILTLFPIVIIILLSILLIRQRVRQDIMARKDSFVLHELHIHPHTAAIILGLIFGLLYGLGGLTSAILVTLTLSLVLDFDEKLAVGTTTCILWFLSLISGIIHFGFAGIIPVGDLVIIGSSAIVGYLFAKKYEARLPKHGIFTVLGFALIILCTYVIINHYLI
jgi:uncharacterized membrane protein YfcA